MIFDGLKNIKEFKDDIYFITHGYDMDKIEEARKENRRIQKEQEKEKRALIPVKWKVIIIVFCSVLLLLNIAELVISISNENILSIVMNIFNIILNIFTIICAAIKNKTTELIALVGVVIILFMTLVVPCF